MQQGIGNLFNARYDAGGTNSTTHGYTAGGINPGTTNIIDSASATVILQSYLDNL